MSLLITPAQLTQRSELFHQLAQLTASGIGLIPALEILYRNPPRHSMRQPLSQLLQQLSSGQTLADSLPHSGRFLSSFDIALLQAGEQSGRLPNCFKILADYYAERAQLARQVIGFVAYPVFVFHIAVLIFPVSKLTDLVLKGAFVAFVVQKLIVILPVYGLALFLCFALQGNRGETWRATLEQIFHRVPVLGKARRSLAIARLSIALEALISAGVTIIEAWDLAAIASGSPALHRVVARAKPDLFEGRTPAEMVRASREFPSTFASLYATGEMSGQLDDALRRSNVLFHEEGSRKLKTFIFGAAGVLVGAVMLGAAWQIISFYLGYFQQINDAMNLNK